MDLNQLLAIRMEAILHGALSAMNRSHLKHYEASGASCTREQLAACLNLIQQSLAEKHLDPLTAHIEKVAKERFAAGYDLSEVQTAINVLEETIWKAIVEHVGTKDLATSLGLVSTVIGAAKDQLARTWVELASRTRTTAIDYQSLFTDR